MVDQQHFADSVARHVPFLSRVVRSHVRGDQIAEDIVQQTVLKALTSADQFGSESALTTWLASIAINEACQALPLCMAQTHRSIDDGGLLQK